jgi:hypothetical protein
MKKDEEKKEMKMHDTTPYNGGQCQKIYHCKALHIHLPTAD